MTPGQLDDKAFETFAYLYPVEAYSMDKERFYALLPDMTKEQIDKLIEETR